MADARRLAARLGGRAERHVFAMLRRRRGEPVHGAHHRPRGWWRRLNRLLRTVDRCHRRAASRVA